MDSQYYEPNFSLYWMSFSCKYLTPKLVYLSAFFATFAEVFNFKNTRFPLPLRHWLLCMPTSRFRSEGGAHMHDTRALGWVLAFPSRPGRVSPAGRWHRDQQSETCSRQLSCTDCLTPSLPLHLCVDQDLASTSLHRTWAPARGRCPGSPTHTPTPLHTPWVWSSHNLSATAAV